MSEPKQPPLILKLGGSVISHSNKIIDFNYLREFRDLLQEQVLRGRKIVVVVGGGQTARTYIEHAHSAGGITAEEDLHWIATAVNTLNAEMVRSFLGSELAEDQIWRYEDRNKIAELKFDKPVAVAGGFLAGRSGDWVALRIAQALGSDKVFDLKVLDGVYSSDPKIDPEAELFDKLTWSRYLEIIGSPSAHKPGSNNPVDAIAAQEARELKVIYYILKATDFANLEAALNGDAFRGTTISDKI